MLTASTLPEAGFVRSRAAARVALPAFRAFLRRTFLRWQERAHERDVCRSLRELDDRTLRDLGFERCRPPRPVTLLEEPTRMQQGGHEGWVWMRLDR